MNGSLLVHGLFVVFALGSIVTAYRVFRTDSMVRAAFFLLASFAGVGGILVLLGAEFLGMVLVLMMAGEMLIMAIVMVMYMMNPAGLNPMWMVHQHRVAAAAGVASCLVLSTVALLADFPEQPNPQPELATEQLGVELLGDSMLVFQTAGVALLATMIGAVALSSRRGRYGEADDGSVEPSLEPAEDETT
ncbi:MAG: NADH-quinone oxidoreductase subunit J family protein [Chloroflexota bacterium]